MRWRCLLVVLSVAAGPGQGAEPVTAGVREKLRTRLIETLPPAPPVRAADVPAGPEAPVLVLDPIVVAEPRGVRALEKLLRSEQERLAAERFTPAKGGTLYRGERLELGSWWSPANGWQFVKIKW